MTSRSQILLNHKDNAIRRNRRQIIKMDSKFVKTENDNDMDNDIQTEATAMRSISAIKLGKPSRYGEYRTVKILFVEGECYV